MKNKIYRGNCLMVMRTLKSNSVDSIVTDPPYGWRFMGKAWDGADIEKHYKKLGETNTKWRIASDGRRRRIRGGLDTLNMSAGAYDLSNSGNQAFQDWTLAWAREALRVLKPGGHAVIFCGPRTYHRMACGVENAGFEVRDQLQWLFGSGFPKSLNLGNGWGTALKPANEPILLARKPLSEKTVAANVLKWGVGGLNIDGCRIGTDTIKSPQKVTDKNMHHGYTAGAKSAPATKIYEGRFPANLVLDEEAAKVLDAQSGERKSAGKYLDIQNAKEGGNGMFAGGRLTNSYAGDTGGASRFFYVAKASKREKSADNTHPTVKPIRLMEYLVRLVTPRGGKVLDPFLGSGTTGIAAKRLGFEFIGIEKEAPYLKIARRRIKAMGTEIGNG